MGALGRADRPSLAATSPMGQFVLNFRPRDLVRMKSRLVLIAVALSVAATACKDTKSETPTPPSVSSPTVASQRGALPAFAEAYPGATVEGDPLVANGPAGPGGVTTFTTNADSTAVMTFYRARAEAAGLTANTRSGQGSDLHYSADRQDTGASIDVVASPVDGHTSVQLTWSAGQ